MRKLTFLRTFTPLAIALSCALPAQALSGDKLNRNGLVQTFNDDFNAFSWYAEGDVRKVGGGTWRTNFGYTWVPVNDVKNHTLVWNGEEQIYVDPGFTGSKTKALGLTAFSVKNGALRITANTTRNTGLYGYKYTSGLITSEPTFTQTYGVFEMRAKLPKGKGLWPAFWLLPADKTWPPEIDIMELLGQEPTKYYTTLHWKLNDVQGKSDIPVHSIPDASANFHTYAVEWGPSEIIFYFNDKEVARRPTPADMHKPFYMLANLAVGGGWPGSPTATTKFPAVMEIDYIRVYQRETSQPAAAVATETTMANNTATGSATTSSTTTKPQTKVIRLKRSPTNVTRN